MVLAGDFNSQNIEVIEAAQTLIVPAIRHERLCVEQGMSEVHLAKLNANKPKDWLICSHYLERLNWEDAFVAQDKQHLVMGTIMRPPPPSPCRIAGS